MGNNGRYSGAGILSQIMSDKLQFVERLSEQQTKVRWTSKCRNTHFS
jgi:hypothetical protein